MAPKLSSHAFTRFWDVHAWSGVVAGLVLYIMFLAGGLTLFHEELEAWEDPLAQTAAREPETLSSMLGRALTAKGSTPDDLWFFPPKHGRGEVRVAFEEGGTWTTAWVDSKTNRLVPERERLAHFTYSLHFLWHDLTGDWLYRVAGLLAVALLLALVTGVLIHIKDIVRQFHQFRVTKSRRVFWSDLHKVVGVMGLPFQLMYAYTGAFIVLGPLLIAAFSGPLYGGDSKRAEAALYGQNADGGTLPGRPAANLSLDALRERARAARPDVTPEYFHLVHYGRDNAVVEAVGFDSGTPRARVDLNLRARDGALLGDPLERRAGASTQRWINGLHFAYFGGVTLRVLFFVLTLAGAATLLSGNLVWLARRAKSRANETLARLTVGVGAGTWVALAALFLASRALPFDWSERGAAEELTFVSALAACILWAFVVRDHTALWWQQFALAACLLVPVPFLAARWSDAGLFGSGPKLAPVVAVDAGLVVVALVLGAGALALRRAGARQSRPLRREQADDATSMPKAVVLSLSRGAPGGTDA